MLLSLIRSGGSFSSIMIMLLLSLPVIALAISFHEFSHAQVAYWLGDPTAYFRGRKTMNPVAHLDPFGILAFMLVGFGWAKPVPIDTGYFKYPKFYMVLTSLAGPFSNLLLAFASMPIMLLLTHINATGALATVVSIFICFFYLMVIYNISFAVFNLLIIPPLDGSRILLAFMPPRIEQWIYAHQRIISTVFLILLVVGVFDYPMTWVRTVLLNLDINAWGWIGIVPDNLSNALSYIG